MAFIAFTDKTDASRFIGHMLSNGYPTTALHAKGDQSIYCVPDYLLENFQELGFAPRLIDRSELAQVLSAKGYEYYLRCAEHSPALLNFDQALPPREHVRVEVSVPENLVDRAKAILSNFTEFEIETRENTRIIISVEQSLSETESSPQVVLTSVVSERHQDEIVRRFSEAQIAGYSRETQIIFSNNPDRR